MIGVGASKGLLFCLFHDFRLGNSSTKGLGVHSLLRAYCNAELDRKLLSRQLHDSTNSRSKGQSDCPSSFPVNLFSQSIMITTWVAFQKASPIHPLNARPWIPLKSPYPPGSQRPPLLLRKAHSGFRIQGLGFSPTPQTRKVYIYIYIYIFEA